MIEMQISGAGGSKFCLEFCVLGCDLGGHGSAGRVQFCGQLRIGYGQDLSGQNGGVFAPFSATVATGMPLGICTVESRASRPSTLRPSWGYQ